MTVAWFELHQELARHRKTKRLARELGITRAQAIGHVVCLWSWAMDHADDGDLTEFFAEEIAEESLWPDDADEFLGALVTAEFVDRTDDTVTIHDWDEYTGRVLEQRRANRLRAKEARERTRTVDEPNAQRTRTVRTAYGATGHDITEQEKTSSTFEQFWNDYPRKVGKRAARAAFEKALKRAPADEIIAGAKRYALDPNRDGQFTAHPTTWLNRDGWDDDPLPAKGSGPSPPKSPPEYFVARKVDEEAVAEFAAAAAANPPSWMRKDLA